MNERTSLEIVKEVIRLVVIHEFFLRQTSNMLFKKDLMVRLDILGEDKNPKNSQKNNKKVTQPLTETLISALILVIFKIWGPCPVFQGLKTTKNEAASL